MNRFEHIAHNKLSEEEYNTLIAMALSAMSYKFRRGSSLENPDKVKEYLVLKIGGRTNELFGCIFLDNRHRVISFEEMFFGTIDGASVHPRVIVQKALELNAAALILYHNHPSGVAEPSRADCTLTKRIIEALALVDIRVLDHLIISPEETVSLAERGVV